jgi:O-methyltransferase
VEKRLHKLGSRTSEPRALTRDAWRFVMPSLSERWRQSRGRRTAKLPAILQPPARFVRNQIVDRSYVYRADGIATARYCPFFDDQDFESSYWEMGRGWFPGADVRWRMWLLTALAQQCQHLPGNFAEFGTWRGGCAYMILSRTNVSAEHRFFLFDTFSGIPADRLTPREREHGFAGNLRDTSPEYVDTLLARWRPRYRLCPGDIFHTLDTVDVGELSFAHIDLNAVAPSQLALEFTYARMIQGGVVVFDDYGFAGSEDQRVMIDEFFAELPEKAIALPTGQAWVIKR